MNIFKQISGDVGGPICDVISFSNVNDIFPNFLLVSREFSIKQIEFSLSKLRNSGISDEERDFFHDLIRKQFEKKGRLNEKLIIKMLDLKILDIKTWWVHPFVNDTLNLFSIFFVFGYRNLVEYCVSKYRPHVEELKKASYFSNNLCYVARYSSLHCFKWFVDFYDIEIHTTRIDYALKGANLEVYRYIYDRTRPDDDYCDFPKFFDFISMDMISSGCKENQILEMFKLITELYGESSEVDLELELSKLCKSIYVFGFTKIIDFCFSYILSKTTEEEEKDKRSLFIEEFAKSIVEHHITNQESIDHLFKFYRPTMEKCVHSDSILKNACYFGQLETIKSKLLSDEINLEILFVIAAERGYTNIIEYLLTRSLKNVKDLTEALEVSVLSGYYDCVGLLIKDGRIQYDKLQKGLLSIILKNCSLTNQNRFNILLRIGKISYFDIRMITSQYNSRKGNYYIRVDDDDIEDSIESEYYKIILLLLDYKKEIPNFLESNGLMESVKLRLSKISLLLFSISEPSTSEELHEVFIEVAKMRYYPQFCELLKSLLQVVDPSVNDFEVLEKVASLRKLLVLLDDERTDPSARENIIIRRLASNKFLCGDIQELDVFKRILKDNRVDPTIMNNFVITNLSTYDDNLDIIKFLIEEDGRVDHPKQTENFAPVRQAVDKKCVLLVEYYSGIKIKEISPYERENEIDWTKVENELKV